MRRILSESQTSGPALDAIAKFHSDVISDLESAIQTNEWVIVGMAGNPFVKRARKAMEAKALPFRYVEQGSYLSKWKERLAIKIWSGWPTFPQVFHGGKLVGGFNELEKYLNR